VCSLPDRTTRMLEILERISEGVATIEEIDLLEQLADDVWRLALRPGRERSQPVLSTLRYFRDEVMAHVVERRCPAKVCRPSSATRSTRRPALVAGLRLACR